MKNNQKRDLGEQIRTAEVTLEDMLQALDAVNEMEDDRSDWEARAFAIMRSFGLLTPRQQKMDADYHKLVDKAAAVQIRLEALAAISRNPIFLEWIQKPSEPGGPESIRGELLEAAAIAELYEGRPSYFKEDEFLARVKEAEIRSQAKQEV